MDAQDYGVFLQRLKMMLGDPDSIRAEYKNRELIRSFYGDVDLRAYCLMPNHFHLLLHQNSDGALPEFMRTLTTSYSMYFNSRYKRVGPLFQGKYRARMVDSDAYNLHISRYIHLNPLEMPGGYRGYPYSSYRFMAHPELRPDWLAVDRLLEYHDDSFAQYERFVEEYAGAEEYEYLSDQFDFDT